MKECNLAHASVCNCMLSRAEMDARDLLPREGTPFPPPHKSAHSRTNKNTERLPVCECVSLSFSHGPRLIPLLHYNPTPTHLPFSPHTCTLTRNGAAHRAESSLAPSTEHPSVALLTLHSHGPGPRLPALPVHSRRHVRIVDGNKAEDPSDLWVSSFDPTVGPGQASSLVSHGSCLT